MHEPPSASLAGSVRPGRIDNLPFGLQITDIRAARRNGLPEARNPFPAMSVAENVVAGLRLAGTRIPRGQAPEIVREWPRAAGLWSEVKEPPRNTRWGTLRRPAAAACASRGRSR